MFHQYYNSIHLPKNRRYDISDGMIPDMPRKSVYTIRSIVRWIIESFWFK